MVACLLSLIACKEDALPGSKNQSVVSGGLEVKNEADRVVVDGRTATLYGVINNEQNREIVECGVYYSTVQGFSEGQAQKVMAASVEGSAFSVAVDQLLDGRTYYYYFYVRHSGGLSLSEEASFEVPEIISEPLVAFDENQRIDGTTLYGVVLSDGHKEVTKYGVEWSVSENMENPAVIEGENLFKEDGSYYFSVDAESIVSEWAAKGELYFRMFATNEINTGYSKVMKISRPKVLPKYAITKLWITGETTAKMEIRCVVPGAGLSAYGYVVNDGEQTMLSGGAVEAGQVEIVELTGLKDGENKVFVFGVNEDGTSLENSSNNRSFTTKIIDKYDSNIRYFELEPIEVEENGVTKYCYFLDRNLGAKNAAQNTDEEVRTDATEEDAGGLFQWGRNGRKNRNTGIGHQNWNSETSPIGAAATLSTVETNHYYKFITSKTNDKSGSWIVNSLSDMDMLNELWNDSQNGGSQNPCPSGYRVPTSAELKGFFLNKENMKIVLANKLRSVNGGAVSPGRTFFWSCKLREEGQYIKAYAWIYQNGWPTSGSSTNIGTGCFIRPVRVEVVSGE